MGNCLPEQMTLTRGRSGFGEVFTLTKSIQSNAFREAQRARENVTAHEEEFIKGKFKRSRLPPRRRLTTGEGGIFYFRFLLYRTRESACRSASPDRGRAPV